MPISMPETPHPHAAPAGRNSLPRLPGASWRSPPGVLLGRPRPESALFAAGAGGPGVVFFYSFTKRFTRFPIWSWASRLGVAPAAAWIAVTGSLDPRILWLTAAVTFWTAGFDVIYSCQDFEFDRSAGLFSLPRPLGIAGALWIARALHLADACVPAGAGLRLHLGWLAWPESARSLLC